MENKNKNNNSSNSLVFGRWPQTKIDKFYLKTKRLLNLLVSGNLVLEEAVSRSDQEAFRDDGGPTEVLPLRCIRFSWPQPTT